MAASQRRCCKGCQWVSFKVPPDPAVLGAADRQHLSGGPDLRTPVGVLCFLPYWAARYVVPPIGGTAPAEWCLLEWCRLLAARYRHDFVPARGAGAAGNGRQEWCCGSAAPAGLRSQAGGNGASGTVPSMVPPIGGTVYGGTVWCRLSAARCGAAYRRHGRVPGDRPARSRGAWQGPAGPCGDARGRLGFRTPRRPVSGTPRRPVSGTVYGAGYGRHGVWPGRGASGRAERCPPERCRALRRREWCLLVWCRLISCRQ